MPKAPIFLASADAQILAQHLLASKPGDVVTYEELSKLIGRSVRHTDPASSVLRSALRLAERSGAVFDCVRTVGYLHLDNEGRVKQASSTRKHIGKSARRARARLSTVDFGQLNQDQRVAFVAEAAVHQAIETSAKPSTIKRLQGSVQPGQKLLSLADTLKMFKD